MPDSKGIPTGRGVPGGIEVEDWGGPREKQNEL